MSESAISSQTLPQIIQHIILCEQGLDRTNARTNLRRRRKTLEGIYNNMLSLVQRIDELLDSESYNPNDYQQILEQLKDKRQTATEELANGYLDFGNVIEELDNIRVVEEGEGTIRESTQHALICAINIMRFSREAKVARGEDATETESMAYILDGGLESLIQMFGQNRITLPIILRTKQKYNVTEIKIPNKFENWVENLPYIGNTILDYICCPITQEIMTDPVSTMDGYTFERKAISTWLETNSDSPLSRQPLTNKKLTTNWNCRKSIISLIDNFLNHEKYTPEPNNKQPTRIYITNFDKPKNKWQAAKSLIRLITNT